MSLKFLCLLFNKFLTWFWFIRVFDHYAHLGGAAFGAVYYAYGPAWWDMMRVRHAKPVKAPKEQIEETS